jgi:hypothetical protein
MKRFYSFLLLALTAVITASAQKYEPNTKWPYVYDTFTSGTIYFEGNEKSSANMNIHLWGNVLHYVKDDGKIYQSDDKKVVRVEIGDDAYIYSDHKLVKILANEGANLLVKLSKADFDAMRSNGGGAYGASLNSSATRDLSSLGFELAGMGNPELGLMLQEKRDGRTIPMVQQYFFIIGGQQIEATKKGVEKFVGEAKADALKQFLKEKKTKWKEELSLAQLLQFLAQ